LLLFFHHVPYTHRLHDGKTVIQEIYDAHYEGANRAAGFVKQWQSLKGRMDDARYEDVLRRFEYQAGHAIVWRDAVCNWFARASGIPDAHGRVGHYPGRIEAESMQLAGYVPFDMTPEEDASGGKGVDCPEPAQSCSAKFQFTGTPGQYELDVEYFDERNGASQFRVFVGEKLVAQWTADMLLPSIKPNADSSTRYRIPGLALRTGEEIRIEGTPNAAERAALDYIELIPAH
jgi:alpha-glucuronidase